MRGGPSLLGKSNIELLYNVTDAGIEVCVKSFGNTDETASDRVGRVGT